MMSDDLIILPESSEYLIVIFIIILFDWWDYNNISELFKVIEELVFNTKQRPYRPTDCLRHHRDKEK